MTNMLDIMEISLLGLFVLAFFHMPKISIIMLLNMGSGMYLYEWFLTAPDPIPSIIVTIINFITIVLILSFGEKGFQKIWISLSLLGFIFLSGIYQTGSALHIIEPGFFILYGVMLLTIIKGAGHGVRNCAKAIYGSYSDRYSHNGNIVHRDKKHS